MEEFVYRSAMPVSATELFEWHARRGALERLTPPWERVRVLERTGGLEDGTRIVLSVPIGPIRMRWVSRHSEVIAGRQFKDEQIEGPFPHWVHTHLMLPDDGAPSLTTPDALAHAPAGSAAPSPSSSVLEDRIVFESPLGAAGRLLAAPIVHAHLRRLFRFRHDTLRGDLVEHARYAARPRLRVAITGARGLIGSALSAFLTTGGHDVIRLVRRAPQSDDEAEWSTTDGVRDPERLGHVDAVVHLAGESIAGENVLSGRWTAARKAAIRRSRVEGTQALARSLARLAKPPAALLGASAIGFYGAQPGEMHEDDAPGRGFLTSVVQAWEAAAAPAVSAGIRVVHLRLGLVLSAAGGTLGPMLPLFQAGLGGRLGSGRQPCSWVGIDDVVGAFHHALMTSTLWGPVNVTAPRPVTNAQFTAMLARVLSRPALLPAPAFALRLVLGREMAEELILTGSRVIPDRLMASGYEFRHVDLEAALRHVLGRQIES